MSMRIFSYWLCMLMALAIGRSSAQDFTVDVSEGCTNVASVFTPQNATGADMLLWDFGDGTENANGDTNSTISHFFTAIGTHTVTMYLLNSGGNITDSVVKENFITVNAPPTANFTISTTSACVGDSVFFTENITNGSNGIDSVNWTFGDGSSSTDRNPFHLYTDTADSPPNSIILNVVDSAGCTAQAIQNNAVTVIDKARPVFLTDVSVSCSNPQIVQITENLSTVGKTGGSIASQTWNWGDGSPTESANIPAPHTYTEFGDYAISLTLENDSGCVSVETINFSLDSFIAGIGVPSIGGNAARLFGDTAYLCTGTEITFCDATERSGKNPNQWDWTINGQALSGECVNVTFNTPGAVDAKLVVRNSDGCIDSVQVGVLNGDTTNGFAQLLAKETVTPQITPQDTAWCTVPVTFDYTFDTASALSWDWSTPDGFSTDSSIVDTFSVLFTRFGDSQEVTLSGIDTNLCPFDYTAHVNIAEPVVIGKTPVSDGCLPLEAKFSDSSFMRPEPTNWFWEFGDDSTSTEQHPTHIYQDSGIFIIKLTVSNAASGCSVTNSFADTIKVGLKPPPATFTPDYTLDCILLTVRDTIDIQYLPNAEGGTDTLYFLEDPTYIRQFTSQIHDTNWATQFWWDFMWPTQDTNGIRQERDDPCRDRQIGGPCYTMGPGTNIQPRVEFANCDAQNVGHAVGHYNCYSDTTVVINAVNYIRPRAVMSSFDDAYSCNAPYTLRVADGTCHANTYLYSWNYDTNVIAGPPSLYHLMDTTFDTLVFKVPISVVDTDIVGMDTTVQLTILQDDTFLIDTTIVPPNDSIFDTTYYVLDIDTFIRGGVTLRDTFPHDQVDSSSNWFTFHPNDTLTFTFLRNGSYTFNMFVKNDTTDTIELNNENGVLDTFYCAATSQLLVTVGTPIPSFLASPREACTPFTSTFFITGITLWSMTQFIDTFIWNFGVGDPSVAFPIQGYQNPQYRYTDQGCYQPYLIVVDNNGCRSDTIFGDSICIRPPVEANLTTDIFAGCPPLSIGFEDNSTVHDSNEVVAWLWRFDDGTTDSVARPTKVFTEKGFRQARLTVTDRLGCQDSVTIDSVSLVLGPNAAISSPNDRICNGGTALFSNTSNPGIVIDTLPQVITYTYTFVDSVVSDDSSATVFHQFNIDADTSTVVPVQLIMTLNGCPDTATTSIEISIPQAKFTQSDSGVICPQQVSFTNTSSLDVVDWRWDFGDTTQSSISDQENPVHNFIEPQSYDVELIVENSLGCVDTTVKEDLVVVTNTAGTIDWELVPLTCGQGYNFLINTDPGVVSVRLIPGDGPEISEDVPVDTIYHLYELTRHINLPDSVNPPFFSPGIVFVDTMGCEKRRPADSIIIPTVQINANFTMSTDTIKEEEELFFNDASTGSNPMINFRWIFDDGNALDVEDNREIKYIYSEVGGYAPSLVITDSTGCMDTHSDSLFVVKHIEIPNVFSPNGDGENDLFFIPNGGIKKYHLEIRDRWGLLQFETRDNSVHWNGLSMSGLKAPSGTYYFILTYTWHDEEGGEQQVKGSLTLLR